MDTSFDYVRDFVKNEAGIVLDAGKEYLVESRLAPLVRSEGLASIEALVQALRASRQTDLHRKVVDAMTTNETTFFRDVEPFELLRKELLPTLIQSRKLSKRLSIWYAASSTGQEPYSVSILIREHFPELSDWKIEQVATDISRKALDRAKAGRYSQLEVNRGMPAQLLLRYFEKHGLEWQLKESIRSMVDYREMNLNSMWPRLPSFDIVFIRNVMIYFDVPAKQKILSRIYDLLRPDGYMFLGAAETTLNLDERFQRLPANRAGCYRPVPK
ncbi:MAG: protein-glutamate O-methyltransferase CheR [Vicinamibacterales bacterium]